MKSIREQRIEKILKRAQEIYDDINKDIDSNRIVTDIQPMKIKKVAMMRNSDKGSSKYGLCNILKTLFGLVSIEIEEYRAMATRVRSMTAYSYTKRYPFGGDVHYLYPPTREYTPQRIRLLKCLLERYLISDTDPLLDYL